MDINRLPIISVLSDKVTICQLEGIAVIRVIHPKANALISLFGGHILHFQPQGCENIIWLSKKADLSGTKAIRGGIPICWPWFGKIEQPAHGFARNCQWELNQHRENQQGVIVSLTLCDSKKTHSIWPYSFHLELQIEISDTLNVSLITTNTDNKTIQFGAALHTYLTIADITQVSATGLGQNYIENNQLITSSNNIKFDDEIDRIYTHPDKLIQILDPIFNRKLSILNNGNNAAVLWNPWQELSKNMPDMNDDGYKTMVCIESANYDKSILLKPDEYHVLSTQISSDNFISKIS